MKNNCVSTEYGVRSTEKAKTCTLFCRTPYAVHRTNVRNNRGSIASIVLMIFAALVVFNIAFLYFAHQAGFYSIVLKKPEPSPKPTITDVDRMIALIKEEKAVIAEKKIGLADQEQKAAEIKKQIDVGDRTLETRKQELTRMLENINTSVKTQDVDKEKRLTALVKTFSVMKPDEVVPVFEKLDPETTMAIIIRMKAKVSAKILEKMNPRQAGLITEMIKSK